ncbi:MAG: hypothetical protein EXS37_09425 [Opitutus sp.]|nr:hypothetical protein [Opitutus sp.]
MIRSPDGLRPLPPPPACLRQTSPAPRPSGKCSTITPRNSLAYRTDAAAAIAAFLDCGDLHAGFTRLHCPDCGHEFLCPFSCKQRGLCASCQQRRTLIEGTVIADEICAPVPHRHVVLTLPRLIRNTFKFNRALLDELYHAARSAITAWLRQRTEQPNGEPGLVVAVQTFGDFLF